MQASKKASVKNLLDKAILADNIWELVSLKKDIFHNGLVHNSKFYMTTAAKKEQLLMFNLELLICFQLN